MVAFGGGVGGAWCGGVVEWWSGDWWSGRGGVDGVSPVRHPTDSAISSCEWQNVLATARPRYGLKNSHCGTVGRRRSPGVALNQPSTVIYAAPRENTRYSLGTQLDSSRAGCYGDDGSYPEVPGMQLGPGMQHAVQL